MNTAVPAAWPTPKYILKQNQFTPLLNKHFIYENGVNTDNNGVFLSLILKRSNANNNYGMFISHSLSVTTVCFSAQTSFVLPRRMCPFLLLIQILSCSECDICVQ